MTLAEQLRDALIAYRHADDRGDGKARGEAYALMQAINAEAKKRDARPRR